MRLDTGREMGEKETDSETGQAGRWDTGRLETGILRDRDRERREIGRKMGYRQGDERQCQLSQEK